MLPRSIADTSDVAKSRTRIAPLHAFPELWLGECAARWLSGEPWCYSSPTGHFPHLGTVGKIITELVTSKQALTFLPSPCCPYCCKYCVPDSPRPKSVTIPHRHAGYTLFCLRLPPPAYGPAVNQVAFIGALPVTVFVGLTQIPTVLTHSLF